MTRNLVPRGVFWSAMSDIETESEEELIEQAYHFKTTGNSGGSRGGVGGVATPPFRPVMNTFTNRKFRTKEKDY